MSPTLRRSRRGKPQSFRPGDRVEVVRDGDVSIGCLVRKVDNKESNQRSSPSSSNPQGQVVRWIVSFEGNTNEQQISERNIGRLVEHDETDSTGTTISGGQQPKSSRQKRGKQTPAKKTATTKKVKFASHNKSKSNDHESSTTLSSPAVKPARMRLSRPPKMTKKDNNTNHNRPRKAGRFGKPKLQENESVAIVKMLTGTLYMYRGPNPRAEFVRAV